MHYREPCKPYTSSEAILFVVVWFVVCFFGNTIFAAAATVEIEWASQLGSVVSSDDTGYAVDVDGNVFIGGSVGDALSGEVHAGGDDAFVRKYDAAGNVLWTDQFGSASNDYVRGIIVDGGGVYATGYTDGALSGATSTGDRDIFLKKYDRDGTVLWTRQFGTPGVDEGLAIAADGAGGIYVVGQTNDAFPGETLAGSFDLVVRKFDASGTTLWTTQTGSGSTDTPADAVVLNGALYVAGYERGSLPGHANAGSYDLFVQQINADGTLGWVTQDGTAGFDGGFGITADDSRIYLTGVTEGSLDGPSLGGFGDVFVRAYSATGTLMWSDQFGTAGYDEGDAIGVDDDGVYVTGFLGFDEALPGQTALGAEDVFVRKYTKSGTHLWDDQLGTAGADVVFGARGTGGIFYAVGLTDGTIAGSSQGGFDVFLVKVISDTDDDFLYDSVDLDITASSTAFSDGTTTGSIVSYGAQTFFVSDSPSTTEGVIVEGLSGPGGQKAQIDACGTTYKFDGNDRFSITCGSTHTIVYDDAVDITFFADDGTIASTTLAAGNELTFENTDGTFTTPEDNETTVVIVTETGELTLGPNEVKQLPLAIAIDIKPGTEDNCINPGANGAIPVALLSSAAFDATAVDPTALSLERAPVRVRGKSGSSATKKDVDGDGLLDLLAHFANTLEFVEGQSTATLSGMLASGRMLAGSDEVCVVPE